MLVGLQAGGPWITPENAMQTVVFSEVIVEGGNQLIKKQLPQPETKLNYYKDIAVLAFPKPKVTIKIDGLDYKNLSDRIRNHLLPDTKRNSRMKLLLNKANIIRFNFKIIQKMVF